MAHIGGENEVLVVCKEGWNRARTSGGRRLISRKMFIEEWIVESACLVSSSMLRN